MLKRQRPVTPPPSHVESPFAAGTSYTTQASSSLDPSEGPRIAKRRRTTPPVLDGRLRGIPTNEDDEEYEDGDSELTDDVELAGEQNAPHSENSSYKGMNMLLHQLHFEHQQRTALVNSLAQSTSSQPLSPSYATNWRHENYSNNRPGYWHESLHKSTLAPSSFTNEMDISQDELERTWDEYQATNR